MTDFTTVTVVLRGPLPDGDLDPDTLRAAITPDEVMFVGVEQGVTKRALEAGADPTSWGPSYEAVFTPQAWINDVASDVDPEGETRWDCTAAMYETVSSPAHGERTILTYFEDVAQRRGENWEHGVLDNDDVLKFDKAAPQWVREWRGPFNIVVYRKVEE